MRTIRLFPAEDRIVRQADGHGRSFHVTGYCSRCGDCCESGHPYTGEPGVCPHFARISPDEGRCTDRSATNTYYQQACRHWPNRAFHPRTYPRCTYIVTEIA